LRAGQLDVFAGVGDPDRIRRIAAAEPLDDQIIRAGCIDRNRQGSGSTCETQESPQLRHDVLSQMDEISIQTHTTGRPESQQSPEMVTGPGRGALVWPCSPAWSSIAVEPSEAAADDLETGHGQKSI
jgi:hypothetical protein